MSKQTYEIITKWLDLLRKSGVDPVTVGRLTSQLTYLPFYTEAGYDEFCRTELKTYLFDHELAKALWGDWPMAYDGSRLTTKEYFGYMHKEKLWAGYYESDVAYKGKIWQYHLQQMVVADDPIKYLGENM